MYDYIYTSRYDGMKNNVVLIGLVSLFFSGFACGIPSGGDCDHLSNPVPSDGASDVVITAKGVQTCIDVDPPIGCSLNITFQWFDYDSYFDAWFDYLEDEGPFPDYHDYEHNYSSWSGVNTSQTLCAWNDNVTCFTDGMYPVFTWRVLTEFDCVGQDYEVSECYFEFTPEECDIFRIYPVVNSTGVCPCCDSMCLGITNEFGHSMNISFYRNDSQFDGFYLVNHLSFVGNGSHCFCIDGHNFKDVYYPVMFNTTYSWYVNVTDTVTNDSFDSDVFFFTTAEPVDCPCGEEDLVSVVRSYSGDEYVFYNDYTLVVFGLGLIVIIGFVVFLLWYKK